LKTVSAFSNVNGGILYFGIDDDGTVVGMENPQWAIEKISEIINGRIDPKPAIHVTSEVIEGKAVVVLNVEKGHATPYYYFNGNKREAFLRIGNESVPVTSEQLNELILKGRNQTYDLLSSKYYLKDFSFSLLKATYKERTGLDFEESDFLSFELIDSNGRLTNAGLLFADRVPLRQSRVFCTRWNGIEKSSIFDDAVDDKEFSGNLLFLLNSTTDFIRNNSRMAWKKTDTGRIEKYDYAPRAYFEAVVNALIHRDYLVIGSEIHVDMYDDRLSIWSPGGMFGGGIVDEKNFFQMESRRRNPILADLFSRLLLMERRGSGLRKMIAESEKLFGYKEAFKPVFHSTRDEFRVTFWNLNYVSVDTPQVTPQVTLQVTPQVKIQKLLVFCSEPRSRDEMMKEIGIKDRNHFSENYLNPLLKTGKLRRTIPDKPRSSKQKYIAV
jgi:ATP-dependent DNA helicase RecG